MTYRISRSSIRNSKKKAKTFFINQKKKKQKSKLYKYAKYILRTDAFIIDYNRAFKCLDAIGFIYDDYHQHWAETDGNSILLNTFKTFSDKSLTDTLIHEAIHNIILRDAKYIIPEEKEHNIMKLIDKDLI